MPFRGHPISILRSRELLSLNFKLSLSLGRLNNSSGTFALPYTQGLDRDFHHIRDLSIYKLQLRKRVDVLSHILIINHV
jgi:hypothetical protein